ncbi:hypothetical protein PGTUg99_036446 [Puccinia graminis f. sp. tritici]|uniref:Uncharacterized protein n=1 Tax=Puccinia graminis f. sp. tritici TaxID=56615 RepID=A0A5B0RVD7_PUCGR|nr:hypothetical protein PGTUg99_036446 [Puccinia graminis f. sp. tritici]
MVNSPSRLQARWSTALNSFKQEGQQPLIKTVNSLLWQTGEFENHDWTKASPV